MTILPFQCTNSYWVTTPSFTQRRRPPHWELQSVCWDSHLANRALPGAWHTLLGDLRAVSPQHPRQSYHKQVHKSWLSSLGQGSPRRSSNDPHLHTPAHNAMVGNPPKSSCEMGAQQSRSERDSCCVKWVEFVCKLRKACPCSPGGRKGVFLVIWAQLRYHAWRTDLKELEYDFWVHVTLDSSLFLS